MLRRWLVGCAVGTLLIALTSPLFVRSYVPRQRDPVRGVDVLQTGARYRWRSEGYATSTIGPLGMVGQVALPPDRPDVLRLALWGDSQAEGVCVEDSEKISSLAMRTAREPIFVLPMARSGDDCNDWLRQIESIQSQTLQRLRIDAHVFLVVQLDDWCVDIDQADLSSSGMVNRVSQYVPAFLIQAARNALTDGQDNQLRRLRFRPGPVPATHAGAARVAPGDDALALHVTRMATQLRRLRTLTDTPCLFLYAPLIPQIQAGAVRSEDPDDPLWQAFRELCGRSDFATVDLRPAMRSSVAAGRWPRGFHHGQFGVGHYNSTGNQIIAQAMSAACDDFISKVHATSSK